MRRIVWFGLIVIAILTAAIWLNNTTPLDLAGNEADPARASWSCPDLQRGGADGDDMHGGPDFSARAWLHREHPALDARGVWRRRRHRRTGRPSHDGWPDCGVP